MKLKSNSILAAVAGLTIATANAAVIQVSGYTQDLIVESGTDASAVTTGAFNVFVPVTTGFTGAGLTGTPLSITSDTLTTQNGTEFFVDADANNTVRNGGTLTLTTAGQYENLQFLMSGDGGLFEATVNFSDASSTVLIPALGLPDWQNNDPNYAAFTGKTSFVNRGSDVFFGSGLSVRELDFTLSGADQAKTITSIDFNMNSRNGVFGLSGTVVPEPSSTALLGLGGLALILRRRR